MANAKFIRLLVGGVPTLINVTDVTTVVAAGAAAAQAATVTITYASGGNTLLTTGATAAINFLAAAKAAASALSLSSPVPFGGGLVSPGLITFISFFLNYIINYHM
jgi:hypothetical protein